MSPPVVLECESQSPICTETLGKKGLLSIWAFKLSIFRRSLIQSDFRFLAVIGPIFIVNTWTGQAIFNLCRDFFFVRLNSTQSCKAVHRDQKSWMDLDTTDKNSRRGGGVADVTWSCWRSVTSWTSDTVGQGWTLTTGRVRWEDGRTQGWRWSSGWNRRWDWENEWGQWGAEVAGLWLETRRGRLWVTAGLTGRPEFHQRFPRTAVTTDLSLLKKQENRLCNGSSV